MVKICDFGLSRCVIKEEEAQDIEQNATKFQNLKKWFNNKVNLDAQFIKSDNGSIMFQSKASSTSDQESQIMMETNKSGASSNGDIS